MLEKSVEDSLSKFTLEDIFDSLNEMTKAIDDHREALVCASFDHDHYLRPHLTEICDCKCH